MKKLLCLFVVVCFCVGGSNLFAEYQAVEDIDYATTGDLYINGDWDNPDSFTDYDFVNFLPGASTEGLIQVNAGGEVHFYGGIFNSEFGEAYEGWEEIRFNEGIVVIHGVNFWVGGVKVPDSATSVDINSYTANSYGYYKIEWEHHDGTIYNIWAAAAPLIQLSSEQFSSEPVNEAPVADAGGPYSAGSVDGGPVAVELSGAASSDADGSIASWKWDLDGDGTYETQALTATVTGSFPVGTTTVGLVVVDDLGLESAPVSTTVTVTELEPEIIVYPETLAYDFGDVEIGTSQSYVVQILNAGQGNLNISSITISGSSDFAMTMTPVGADGTAVIAPDEVASTDVEITFTPSTENFVQATLTIVSDDADEGIVEVLLSGSGSVVEVPVEEQIQATIDFYNQSITDGTILGYAPKANSKAADNRVKALGNMLKSAGNLVELGETALAIDELNSAAKKTDGEKRPPDFVVGDGVAELNQRIDDIIAALSI